MSANSTCPKCNQIVPEGNTFCEICGVRILPEISRPPVSPEIHRPITDDFGEAQKNKKIKIPASFISPEENNNRITEPEQSAHFALNECAESSQGQLYQSVQTEASGAESVQAFERNTPSVEIEPYLPYRVEGSEKKKPSSEEKNITPGVLFLIALIVFLLIGVRIAIEAGKNSAPDSQRNSNASLTSYDNTLSDEVLSEIRNGWITYTYIYWNENDLCFSIDGVEPLKFDNSFIYFTRLSDGTLMSQGGCSSNPLAIPDIQDVYAPGQVFEIAIWYGKDEYSHYAANYEMVPPSAWIGLSISENKEINHLYSSVDVNICPLLEEELSEINRGWISGGDIYLDSYGYMNVDSVLPTNTDIETCIFFTRYDDRTSLSQGGASPSPSLFLEAPAVGHTCEYAIWYGKQKYADEVAGMPPSLIPSSAWFTVYRPSSDELNVISSSISINVIDPMYDWNLFFTGINTNKNDLFNSDPALYIDKPVYFHFQIIGRENNHFTLYYEIGMQGSTKESGTLDASSGNFWVCTTPHIAGVLQLKLFYFLDDGTQCILGDIGVPVFD